MKHTTSTQICRKALRLKMRGLKIAKRVTTIVDSNGSTIYSTLWNPNKS